jgi:hypothetical protein
MPHSYVLISIKFGIILLLDIERDDGVLNADLEIQAIMELV